MPKGISLNLGLNSVDPAQYNGQLATLLGCENDARDMHNIALSQGFDAQLLLGQEVTSTAVIKAIGDAATNLDDKGIFLLTYSGHGSTILDDINGDEFNDSQDETLVLYDRNLIDDELYALWKRFKPGARIFFISDSCHSGTQAELSVGEADVSGEAESSGEGDDDGFFTPKKHVLDENGDTRLIRSPTGVEQANHVGRNEEKYDAIRYVLTEKTKVTVEASVIQFGACQDKQNALDGVHNGLFTSKLRVVWADGGFQGNYKQFFEAIRALVMPFNQEPNLFKVGVKNPAFEAERPFTI